MDAFLKMKKVRSSHRIPTHCPGPSPFLLSLCGGVLQLMQCTLKSYNVVVACFHGPPWSACEPITPLSMAL